MVQRGKLVLWLVVVILLVLGVIGYMQGWFGRIFGASFDGTRASVSTQDAFDEGTYGETEYKDGMLQLKTEQPGGGQ